jgi:hypothetical protein
MMDKNLKLVEEIKVTDLGSQIKPELMQLKTLAELVIGLDKDREVAFPLNFFWGLSEIIEGCANRIEEILARAIRS